MALKDQSMTCLLAGCCVGKEDLRVDVLGNFDELNAALGLAAAWCTYTNNEIKSLQNDLHTLCAEIAAAGTPSPLITVVHLQHLMDILHAYPEVERQHTFFIPGGTKGAAFLDMARTIARRAERSLVGLSREFPVREDLLAYANKLSLVIYRLGRVENKRAGIVEEAPVYAN